MGYDLSIDDLNEAFKRFIALADRKKTVADDDIEAIANSLGDVPEIYKLVSFQIQCGNRIQSLASVTLLHGGGSGNGGNGGNGGSSNGGADAGGGSTGQTPREITEAATGDGPIDAAYNAAEKIVGGKWPLISYDIKAVTGGMDALGEVIVRVQYNDKPHVGRGLSTDIMEASISAYVNAINRALSKS
jgi:2-isopropylmalate synthase